MPEVTIHVKEWIDPPLDTVLDSLTGKTVHVLVGGRVGPAPTSFGEFFRFARVVKTQLKPAGASTTCVRCSSTPARWQIAVQWEVGHSSPDGDVLCEHCVCGVVSSGAEQINFSPASST